MASTPYTMTGNWVAAGAAATDNTVAVVSHLDGGAAWAYSGTTAPTAATAGNIVPANDSLNMPVKAAETLYLRGRSGVTLVATVGT